MAASKGAAHMRPDDAFSDTAKSVLRARLDELVETHATISGASDADRLHDLRIAAKRLRYSLETFAVCFPEKQAQERADTVRNMQDVLGRIHDLDVLHELMEDHIAAIELAARTEAMRLATSPSDDERRTEALLDLARTDGRADGRLGLYKVIAAKADERRQLYDQFVTLWAEWEESGFLAEIQTSISHEVQGHDGAPATT